MALADPQTITINSVAQTLNRISTSGMQSVYATADETYKFTVSHLESKNKRTRRLVKIMQRAVVADPLTPDVSAYKDLGVHLVIDEPEYGFDDTTIGLLVAGFIAWLTPTNVGKVCSSQH